MIKSIVLLLCINYLYTVRSDGVDKKDVEDASSVFSEILYTNYETLRYLNEQIDMLTSDEEEREQEVSSLNTTITELLRTLNGGGEEEALSHNFSPVAWPTPGQLQCDAYLQVARQYCAEAAYQALLGYGQIQDRSKTNWWGYAGVIISDRYILTSGRRAVDPDVLRVALGQQHQSEWEADWQIYEITDIVVHPEYERSSNNLALLKTETPIQFSYSVLPACLPSGAPLDEEAVITTWYQRDGGNGDTIRSVKVQKHSPEECAAGYDIYNGSIHICFGHRKRAVESYRTNIGDPLMSLSLDYPCVSTVLGMKTNESWTYPELFTKVSHYVPWIETVVWP